MTNISSSPAKVALRRRLRTLGEEALRREGWTVEPAGVGKSSMRKISRGSTIKLATIRTSQDTWVAFPRNDADSGWSTLEDADVVVLASVDHSVVATRLKAHVIDADTVRSHFDRAYSARIAAMHQIQKGRGVWIALYENEAQTPTNLVGAGLGLLFPAVLDEPINATIADRAPAAEPRALAVIEKLTISDAKAILARSLGVAESAIRISVDV
jgi:hypothetical protein